MSIKVIGKKNDNLIMKCSNCNHEEESYLLDSAIKWGSFNLDAPDYKNSVSLHITCLKCGHKQPRKSVGFAKLKNSPIIHFCQTLEGHLYQSRCGVLSKLTTDGKIQVIEDINRNSILCKSCGSVEGNIQINKKSFTKKDILKDTKYKLLMANN